MVSLILNNVVAALCVKAAVRRYGVAVFVCHFVKAVKLAVLFVIIIVHKTFLLWFGYILKRHYYIRYSNI